jgi:hypothetical protein
MALGAAVNTSEPTTNNNLNDAVGKVSKNKPEEGKIAGQWNCVRGEGRVWGAGRYYDTVT